MQQFLQPPSPFHPSQLRRHQQQQPRHYPHNHSHIHNRDHHHNGEHNLEMQGYAQRGGDVNMNGNINRNGNNGTFDITLIAQGERFPANRQFLSESSIMFEQMLRPPRVDSEGKEISESEGSHNSDGTKSNLPSELHLPNMRKDHLRPILEYLYTDRVDICCIGYALSLCLSAQRYLLESMVEVLEDYILEHTVSPSMALSLYRFSDTHGLTELKHELTLRICDDLLGHSVFPAFSRLDIRHVEEMVRHEVADVVDVDDDFDLVEVIAHWIRPGNYTRTAAEAADWKGACRECGRDGIKVWENVENITKIESDRTHYEERLFRNLDLSFFNHQELMELREIALQFNLEIVAQKTVEEAQDRR